MHAYGLPRNLSTKIKGKPDHGTQFTGRIWKKRERLAAKSFIEKEILSLTGEVETI